MFEDKALTSLAAADYLLEGGFVDRAANAYYYAMYQAAVHRLDKAGRKPGQLCSGAVWWEHAIVRNNAVLLRGERGDRFLYRDMLELRRQADYEPESVAADDVEALRDDVRRFVEELVR